MAPESTALSEETLQICREQFRSQKKLADAAISQLKPDDFHRTLDIESNSVALIMKHIAGNAISRWTDFLTSDGEKPNRHRDAEFIDSFESLEDLKAYWERGWDCVFRAMDSLSPEDLMRTVYIRKEPHSVVKAITRQISHYGYHVGQIVFLAKHFRSETWKTLSIPRGKSEEFLTAPPKP